MNLAWNSSNVSNSRSRGVRQLSLEASEPRVMLSADGVFWQNDTPPANGFSAEVRGKSLVLTGKSGRDYVLVHDIVANKWHENWDSDLVRGQKYIEIQHRHQNTLRRAWLKQDPMLEFVFLGGDGNDYFHYIETSGDPAPRHVRRIIAFGGPGNDSLHGFSDDDILVGGADNDSLFGELGSDLLVGGRGNDTLWGDNVSNPDRQQHADTDYLVGGVGEDTLRGWQGGDLLNGGDFGNVDDGQLDYLYGLEHRDCFYFESSEIDVRNDFDPKIQQDEMVVSSNPQVHGHSPSLYDWLQSYHPDLNLPFADQVKVRLPDIASQNFRVLMPATLGFNCHAGALSILCQNIPQDASTDEPSWYDNHFRQFGFTPEVNADPYNLPDNDGQERILLFGRDATLSEKISTVGRMTWVPTHSVLQLSDGTFVSKLDTDGPLVVHQSLDDLESHFNIYTNEFVSYGKPRRVYVRPRLDLTCNGVLPNIHTSAVILGDVNQDGLFDSSDLTRVFVGGKYNDTVRGAAYDEGDWNGDGVFDSADLVAAFQSGNYSWKAKAATRTIDAVDHIFAGDDIPGAQLLPDFAGVALQ